MEKLAARAESNGSVVTGNSITLSGNSGTGLSIAGSGSVANNTVTGGAVGILGGASASSAVQNNQVTDAAAAVRLTWPNTLTFSGNTYTGVGFKGAQVAGTVGTDQTWSGSQLTALGLDPVYHVVDDVTVAAGAKLTIEAGTVVKFALNRASSVNYSVKLHVNGALWAQGTAGSKIYFTTVDDPTVGGSAGGDGTPNAGDWGFIEFNNSSDDANCLLEHCVLRYGGNYYRRTYQATAYSAIRCEDASPTIRNCTFTECMKEVYGSESVSGFCRPQILTNTIQRTGSYGWSIEFTGTAAPVIVGNTFNLADSGISLATGAGTVTGNTLILSGNVTGINSGAGGSVVTGNSITLSGNSGTGLSIAGSGSVANNTVTGGAVGILGGASASSAVQNNQVTDAAAAVRLTWPNTLTFSGNTYTGVGFKGAQVAGTVGTDQTWSGSQLTALGLDPVYHVVDDVTVAAGAKLTIEAGTVVKFALNRASSVNYSVKLHVNGALWAQGTAGSKIYFTTVDDPTVGGSAGGDGTPNAGDWGFIEFNNSSDDANCLLEHCVLRYGGNYYRRTYQATAYSAIRCEDASPTIRNCTFTECMKEVYGSESVSGFCRPQILTNTIQRTGSYGWSIEFTGTAAPVIVGNTFNLADSGISLATGAGTVTGNTLILSGNVTGINSGAGGSVVTGNSITLSGNSGTGLSIAGSGSVANNTVTGGAVGILGGASASSAVQNNQVTDAAAAVRLTWPNTLTFSGNTYTGVGFKGAQVAGTVGTDQTWSGSQLTALGLDPVYHVVDDVTVAAGAKLTIEAGTVVKFALNRASSVNYSVKLHVNGALWAQGTAGSKIYFTTVDDPTVGGSAGGDGTPNAGDWGFIEFNNSSDDANCLLEHCVLRYGGNYYRRTYQATAYSAIRCEDASPTIRNCTFSECLNGIYCSNGEPLISRCTFTNVSPTAIELSFLSVAGMEPRILANTFDGCPTAIKYTGSTSQGNGTIAGNLFQNGQTAISVSKVGSSLEVYHNQFVGITTYGIQNTDSTGTVLAQGNWWGSSTGPGGVAGGSGAPVSAYVNYANWWTSPNQTPDGVWNVIAIRKAGTAVVDIYYDLVGSASSYNVSFEASKTGGDPYTFTLPSVALSGARGSGVSPGANKHAIWESSIGNTGTYTDQMRIKVTADLE